MKYFSREIEAFKDKNNALFFNKNIFDNILLCYDCSLKDVFRDNEYYILPVVVSCILKGKTYRGSLLYSSLQDGLIYYDGTPSSSIIDDEKIKLYMKNRFNDRAEHYSVMNDSVYVGVMFIKDHTEENQYRSLNKLYCMQKLRNEEYF